jgi:hypothetical protein
MLEIAKTSKYVHFGRVRSQLTETDHVQRKVLFDTSSNKP